METIFNNEIIPTSESRFGDPEKIVSILHEGKVEVLGKIDDLITGIAPHRNIVEVANIKHIEINSVTRPELLMVVDGEVKLYGVFKPHVGLTKFQNENGLEADYSREHAAYLISDELGLDVVPPTTTRIVDGRVGSLQLFLPREYFTDFENIEYEESEYEKIYNCPDAHSIAVLDWLIANGDRHGLNYLGKVIDGERVDLTLGYPQLYAIDNGAGFNTTYYKVIAGRKEVKGPSQHFTYNSYNQESLKVPIPEDLKIKINKFSQKLDYLEELLRGLPDINSKEIDYFLKRFEMLVNSNHHLSPMNTEYKTIDG